MGPRTSKPSGGGSLLGLRHSVGLGTVVVGFMGNYFPINKPVRGDKGGLIEEPPALTTLNRYRPVQSSTEDLNLVWGNVLYCKINPICVLGQYLNLNFFFQSYLKRKDLSSMFLFFVFVSNQT